MLIVTHNDAIKNMVHKVILIKDGQISKDYENEKRMSARELTGLQELCLWERYQK